MISFPPHTHHTSDTSSTELAYSSRSHVEAVVAPRDHVHIARYCGGETKCVIPFEWDEAGDVISIQRYDCNGKPISAKGNIHAPGGPTIPLPHSDKLRDDLLTP